MAPEPALQDDGTEVVASDVKLLQAFTAARLLEREQQIEDEIENHGDYVDLLGVREAPSVGVPAAGQCDASRRSLGRTVEVRVNGLAGYICSVTADALLQVHGLKSKIALASGAPVEQQRLFLGTTELADQDLVFNLTPPASPVADVTMARVNPEWQRCVDMVSIAGMQLAVVPDSLRSDMSVVLAAVRQNGAALQYADLELRNCREIAMAAVQERGVALEFASQELQADREVAMAAVRHDGMALRFSGPGQRADKEIVFAAVQGTGQAFQFADEALQGDRNFALAVVKEAGLALEFAAMCLRFDREIVHSAVLQDGLALEFAHEELRGDREIVLDAVRSNGLALWDAREDLKTDPEILAAAKSALASRAS
mmetsp:Transcript_100699/g.291029  ORF Transcript_100699/g.291029 Transcript_100699/m.291029 type:complete len:371 (+) Transcript_100699:118-1230(+)